MIAKHQRRPRPARPARAASSAGPAGPRALGPAGPRPTAVAGCIAQILHSIFLPLHPHPPPSCCYAAAFIITLRTGDHPTRPHASLRPSLAFARSRAGALGPPWPRPPPTVARRGGPVLRTSRSPETPVARPRSTVLGRGCAALFFTGFGRWPEAAEAGPSLALHKEPTGQLKHATTSVRTAAVGRNFSMLPRFCQTPSPPRLCHRRGPP